MMYICKPIGALAEWLGAGLQNLSQWFDSATHLQKCLYNYLWGLLLSKMCLLRAFFLTVP